MICKILNNAKTSHIKCLLATLIDVFIYILVLFHIPKKNGNFIFIEPHIIPSLGDTGLIYHYGWLKAKKEGKELYTILPKSKNMKYCFGFANLFCNPENIEEYSNPLFKILLFLLLDKYISFAEVILLNRLRKKYNGLKVFTDYDLKNDKILPNISQPDMREAYIKRNSLDYFFYGHKKYNELLKSSDFKKLEVDLNNKNFENLKSTLKIDRKYICVHIKQQKGLLHPRFVFEKDNYLKTFKYLMGKGYQIVLMGDADLSIVELEGVVNYCKSEKQSIFNDTILIKNCDFYIGNSSGPLIYPAFFETPILLVNAICMATLTGQNLGILTKNIYKDGKKLSIQELFESPIYYFDTNDEFDRLGYEYKDNSENQIYNSLLEFEKLVNFNVFSLSIKQENFQKTIKAHHMGAFITKGFVSYYML